MGGGASVMGGQALGSSPSLFGALSQYGKPAMQGMQMAQQSGLLGGEKEAQPSPFIQQPTNGFQTLTQIAQQGAQEQELLLQADKMRRQRRAGLLGREM
jgi:hypothetical protein